MFSSTLIVDKSLSHQIKSSTTPSTSLPWPAGVFAKAVEKEFWLERFGGPGRTIERVAGEGTVVLRDFGEDGKAYLRVLI